MKLYTSTGTLKTIEKCNKLGISLLMVDHWRDPDKWPTFAIDNGCYAAYHRRERWNPIPFLKILDRCEAERRTPDFVVIPDKVADPDSIGFSKTWVGILKESYPNMPYYLAVQNGMDPGDVTQFCRKYDIAGLFVGGTMEWKLRTAGAWTALAHGIGIKCHVGRIGPTRRILAMENLGVDSIDSTTWVQNRGGIERYVLPIYSQTRLNI